MRRPALFLTLAAGLLGCGGSSGGPAPAEAPKPAPAAEAPAKEDAAKPDPAESDKPKPESDKAKPESGEAKPEAPKLEGPGAGVEVVVLHEHELLGSEGRALDKFAKRLEKKGLKVTRVDTPDAKRSAALKTWLSTRDADERGKLSRIETLGDSAAVVVMQLRAPGGSKGNVTQGQSRFGVLARHEDLLWLEVEGSGVKLLGDLDDEFVAMIEQLEGVKG